MPTAPVLPPGFRARPGGADPWGAALAAASSGGEAGTVFWSGADGHCRAALVFEPDRPLGPTVVGDLGLLALFDALAALAPPQRPITVAPPDRLLLNGGEVATVRSAQGPGLLPDWAVLGLDVAIAASQAEPGMTPDRTCLQEEGFGPLTPEEVLEQVCRYLLSWVDAWQDEGTAGLARTVAQRSEAMGAPS